MKLYSYTAEISGNGVAPHKSPSDGASTCILLLYIYIFGGQTLNFTKNKKIKNNKIMLININHDNVEVLIKCLSLDPFKNK